MIIEQITVCFCLIIVIKSKYKIANPIKTARNFKQIHWHKTICHPILEPFDLTCLYVDLIDELLHIWKVQQIKTIIPSIEMILDFIKIVKSQKGLI